MSGKPVGQEAAVATVTRQGMMNSLNKQQGDGHALHCAAPHVVDSNECADTSKRCTDLGGAARPGSGRPQSRRSARRRRTARSTAASCHWTCAAPAAPPASAASTGRSASLHKEFPQSKHRSSMRTGWTATGHCPSVCTAIACCSSLYMTSSTCAKVGSVTDEAVPRERQCITPTQNQHRCCPTHLLAEQAGDLREVDLAALGAGAGHQGHAVPPERLLLASWEARLHSAAATAFHATTTLLTRHC